MIKSNSRGSVLIHVLITGVIVAIIAAGMMRMVLMNYIAIDRVTKGGQNRKEADAMLNRAISYWNFNNQVCSNIPGGLNCVGTAGTCNCSCPSAAAIPRIYVRMVGSQCAVDLISSDPQ